MSQKILIPRALDRTLLEVFVEATKLFSGPDPTVYAVGGTSFPFNASDWAPVVEDLVSRNGTMVTGINGQFDGVYVAYERGGNGQELFDSLEFKAPQHLNTPDSTVARVRVVDHFAKAFKAVDPTLVVGGPTVSAQRQLEAAHNITLQRLEGIASDLIKRQAAHAAELDDGFIARRKAMDEEFDQRRTALEKVEEARKSEHAERLEKLRLHEADLDDRANRHARRDIHRALRDKLLSRQKDFSLTTNTRRLRWPIHAASVALMAALGTLIWWFSAQTLEVLKSAATGNGLRIDAVYAILRSAALAAAFAATALFYLRWLNQWAERHSEAEFQIRKLELDVDRANWVFEAALEWDTQVKKPMPDALLEGITRNLFEPVTTSGKGKDDPSDPVDQLASALLGSAASKVKLKSDGNHEIELEPGKIGKNKG